MWKVTIRSIALVVLAAGLAGVDAVVELHADHAAGAEPLGLRGRPGERHLARRVDALREVGQLLVGLREPALPPRVARRVCWLGTM